MSVHSRASFDDDLQRAIYDYVERHGSVTRAELVQSIRLETNASQSKPARSGTYTHEVAPSTEEIRSCLESLQSADYLVESDGRLRLALDASPRTLDLECGTLTLRPARERDRETVLETMRVVAADGSYVVAETLAERLERDSAVVRVNGDRSRLCFVASLDSDEAESEDREDDRDTNDEPRRGIAGWYHLEAPEYASRAHTAEVTVGVHPDARGQGIGAALLEYGSEWAGEQGYHKLTQGVPATSERAIEFLEDNGWHREGERTDQYRIDDAFVDEVLFAAWPS